MDCLLDLLLLSFPKCSSLPFHNIGECALGKIVHSSADITFDPVSPSYEFSSYWVFVAQDWDILCSINLLGNSLLNSEVKTMNSIYSCFRTILHIVMFLA